MLKIVRGVAVSAGLRREKLAGRDVVSEKVYDMFQPEEIGI
jgi:hypothetical protein